MSKTNSYDKISAIILIIIFGLLWFALGCEEPNTQPPPPPSCTCETLKPDDLELDIKVIDNYSTTPFIFLSVVTYKLKWIEEELRYEDYPTEALRLTYQFDRIFYAMEVELNNDTVSFIDLQTGEDRKLLANKVDLDKIEIEVMDLGPHAKQDKVYADKYVQSRKECPVHGDR
jgi:hypothetical protein